MTGTRPPVLRQARPDPVVSVVVATHKRPARLEALLDSLRAQRLTEGQFEVVVVDDASGPSTHSALERAESAGGLNLRVIARAHRGGPAIARNQGWRAAHAPIVAFTDDDCVAAPGWLEALTSVLRDHPGSPAQGRTEPNPSDHDALGPFSRTLSVTELGPHYQTCNMAYPRALLERTDGFDESYPVPGGEDTDLAWRVLEAGIPIVFAPDALIHHAVNVFGPLGMLRFALRWSDTMQVFGRHPDYRRLAAHDRLFWKGSHAALVRAALGLALARRFPPAALLALSYVRHLAHQCRADGASPWHAPYFVAYDAIETLATLRGAARYRVLIL